MAIYTVTVGSSVNYSSLNTIRAVLATSAEAWGVSAPSEVNTTRPKANDYDSIKNTAISVFNAEKQAGATSPVTTVSLNHSRGSTLQADDINVLGGNKEIRNVTTLVSGLVTYISGFSPCSCDGQCYSCSCNGQCYSCSCNSQPCSCDEEPPCSCDEEPPCSCDSEPPCSCDGKTCTCNGKTCTDCPGG